jgi:hypothetical protein
MEWFERIRSGRARCAPSRIAVLPLSLVVLCLACGSSSQVGVTADSAPQPLVPVIRSASVRVPSRADTPVSVSCQPGEQLLGGGFVAYNLFEYAAYLSSSYPSSATTWTVVGSAPAAYFNLEVDAYCASVTRPASIHVVHTTGSGGATAVCPHGSVLLGGGFHAADPVTASRPQGNGWMAGSTGTHSDPTTAETVEAYALCASRLVQPGQVVQATFNAHSMTHGYQPSGADAACPSGQIALGGGYATGELVMTSAARDTSFGGWAVSAGGEADVTLSAVCVQPPA